MLDHREAERDLLRAGHRREPLMHAQYETVSTRLPCRDEHLETQSRDVLRLIEGRGRELRRRRERGEEGGRDEDHDEDRRLGHRVADERGPRAQSRAKPGTPAKEVEGSDDERDGDEDDLDRERDPVRRLVEVLDEHEPVEGLQRPRGDEDGDRDERREREAQDRGAERACVVGALVAVDQQHAPEQRHDAAAPHRDRQDVREVEHDVLERTDRRRV